MRGKSPLKDLSTLWMQPTDEHARLPPSIPSTSKVHHVYHARSAGSPGPYLVGPYSRSAGISHLSATGAEHDIQRARAELPQQRAYRAVHTYSQYGSYPPSAEQPSRPFQLIQPMSEPSSQHSSPSPLAPHAHANGPMPTHISTPSGKAYRRPVPCESCREWRRKCDLGKPTCNRCQERGQDCVYILQRYDRKKHTMLQKPATVMNPMSISSMVDEDDVESVASEASKTEAGPWQRALTPRNLRERACQSCHKRKTKCDKQKPSCGDCLTRGMSCQY
ncbi:hypothetical protein BC830DRAFT_703436 [Chytriomyces sp. MP71]|nr:hypothetical protein BC830DRAFT_703436 [Chytriomyces sp. MP71]